MKREPWNTFTDVVRTFSKESMLQIGNNRQSTINVGSLKGRRIIIEDSKDIIAIYFQLTP